MNVDVKYINRFVDLIALGQKVLKTERNNSSGGMFIPSSVSSELFHEWRTSCINSLEKVFGRESTITRNFISGTGSAAPHATRMGLGILSGAKKEIELGFLSRVEDFVAADIFTDFIEMARHLSSEGYKDPAASLAGAVLEDSLRKICKNNQVAFSKRDGIDSLNKALHANSIYNKIVFKSVDSWREIRNSADHGRFDEYTAEQVSHFIEGLSSFLESYLS